MNTIQASVSILFMIGFASAVDVGNGTAELCQNSPRELDLAQCFLTSETGSINYVRSFYPIAKGYCKVQIPAGTNILAAAITIKVDWLFDNDCSANKRIFEAYDSNEKLITDKYLPQDSEVFLTFNAGGEKCDFEEGSTGVTVMRIMYEDQFPLDGYCFYAEGTVVQSNFVIPKVR